MSKKLIWTEEELPQGSEEWLAWRRGEGESGTELTIGGSETAALMYMSPWTLPQDLYKQKLGLVEKTFSDSARKAMAHGTAMEPFARAAYETTFETKARQLCAIHPEYPWMRTSLDGITEDNRVVLEIKSPSSLERHIKQTMGNVIPAYRYPQLQWQLAVMREHFEGVERVDYVSYFADLDEDGEFLMTDMVVIPILPDEEFIAEIVRRAKIFIQYLKARIMPPATIFSGNMESLTYPPRGSQKTYQPGKFF